MIYFCSFFFLSLIIYVHETFFKKEVLKKSDSRRRGMELDDSVYTEWYMNKNIQRADFTQYENLLLRVSGHYFPGGKEDHSENAQIAKLACFKYKSLETLCTMCELFLSQEIQLPSWLKIKLLPSAKSLWTTERETPTRCGGGSYSAQSRLFCEILVSLRW